MIKCDHCGKEYKTSQSYIDDCFTSSDGWTWDYFHNCLKDEDHMVLNGYKSKN